MERNTRGSAGGVERRYCKLTRERKAKPVKRSEQKKALREARHYLSYHHSVKEDFDKEGARWEKEKLHVILAICEKAIKLHGGKIREADYQRQDNGSYKTVYTDIADAKIVAGLVKERLVKIERIIANTPIKTPRPERTLESEDTDYSWSDKYAWYHCLQSLRKQREVKRKQRIKAKRASHSTPWKQALPELDELFELELSFEDRSRHRKGWKSEWQPTRDRYWRPNNNNWKEQNKCRKQYLVHLD
jgi:hypothetical protein